MEESEPNLDEVLDFRFMAIEAELSVIVEHSESIERELPGLITNERERLEAELTGSDEDEYVRQSMIHQIDEFADEMLPGLYRSPILVALWAIFESAILEIATYLQKEGGHRLGVDDLRGENVFARARKYYEHILAFPLIESDRMTEELNVLLFVRNAIAHVNGRIEVIKARDLEKIRAWEKTQGGIRTDGQYLTFTGEFVQRMSNAVKASLDDLIKRVRESTG